MSCQLTVSLCLDNCEPQTVIVNHRITGGFADDPEVNNLKITAAHGSKGTLKVTCVKEDGVEIGTSSLPFEIPTNETAKTKTLTLHPRDQRTRQTTLKIRIRKTDVMITNVLVGLGPHLDWYNSWRKIVMAAKLEHDLSKIKRKREELHGWLMMLDKQEQDIKLKLQRLQ